MIVVSYAPYTIYGYTGTTLGNNMITNWTEWRVDTRAGTALSGFSSSDDSGEQAGRTDNSAKPETLCAGELLTERRSFKLYFISYNGGHPLSHDTIVASVVAPQ